MNLNLTDLGSEFELCLKLAVKRRGDRLDEGVKFLSAPAVAVTAVPGTRNFNVTIAVPDPEYEVWIKSYSSSTIPPTKTIISGNPLQLDNYNNLTTYMAPTSTSYSMTITAPMGEDNVLVRVWTLDNNGTAFNSSDSGWKPVAPSSSSSSSSSGSSSNSGSTSSSSSLPPGSSSSGSN